MAMSPRIVLCLAALLPWAVMGIEFDLVDRGPSDPGAKCMLEEMNDNVLVLLDYSSVDGTKISAKLEDPNGQVFWTLDGAVTGHYGFTTTKAGDYKICFTKSEPGSEVTSHKVTLPCTSIGSLRATAYNSQANVARFNPINYCVLLVGIILFVLERVARKAHLLML
eukprot:4336520-Pyramimonas_sp.AAC.1